ncbi:MAG: transporter substrate-binding domain-containing protein [Gammaproteobacteria bacterium]|nr:transporter substrate-binding domain-containing protein [Gammaproteobacteria bacterium]
MKFYTKIIATALFAATTISSTWAGESLDRVMNDKMLTVATDANWPPMSFLNDDNEMDGFDVSVAREIAKRLGVDVEFVTPDWGIITAGNWHGRWDISIGSMTPTKARAEVLSFPGVYYFNPASFVVHKDSTATKKSDLNGKKICVASGSTHEFYLQHDLEIDAIGVPAFEYEVTPGKILSLPGGSDCLTDLRLGDGVRIDALFDTLPAGVEASKAGMPVKVIGTPAFYEPLSVAIDKGDAEFDAKLAEIIKAMHADGTISEMSIKWFSIDYSKTAN